MKKFIIFISVLLISVVATGSIFNPARNNNPIKPIIIYGKFPFERGYNLEVTQYAYSTSRLSKFICGGFGFFTGDETGISCESTYDIRETKQIGCCSYEVIIYEDYYLPGIFNWRSAPILASIYHKNTKDGKVRKSIPITNKNYICSEKNSPHKSAPNIYCIENSPSPTQTQAGRLEINYILSSISD